MAPSWITTTIGAQVLLQRGFDITKAQQRSGTVPVVSSGGVSSYHDTPSANGPGVVLGRKGTLGSVFYLDQDYWPHDTTLWVKDFKGNVPRFVYYFFRSMSAELLALDNATADPALNRNHVHPIEVLWPSRRTQEAIVDVLGVLDEQNRTRYGCQSTIGGIGVRYFSALGLLTSIHCWRGAMEERRLACRPRRSISFRATSRSPSLVRFRAAGALFPFRRSLILTHERCRQRTFRRRCATLRSPMCTGAMWIG